MMDLFFMGNESTTLVHRRGCVDLRLNIFSDNIVSVFTSTSKLNDSILWHARLGHVHFKRMQDMSKDGLILAFNMDTKKCKTCMLTKITKKPFQNVKHKTKVLKLIHSDLCDLHDTPSLGNKKYFVIFIDDASRAVVRLPDPKLKTLGERGTECIFVGYAKHSKAFRFYVIEPNDSVLINSIIESRDTIFDENRFSLVRIPSLKIPNGTEYIGGSVVLKDVTKEKEAINDEMDSIMSNNTWVLADLPLGCRPLGCKWIFKRKLKVDGTVEKFKARLVIQGIKQKSGIDYFNTYAPVVDRTKEFLSSRFSIKDIGKADVILGIKIEHESNVSTLMDISKKLLLNNGQAVSQLEYSRMIGCLMYGMTCTRPNIAFSMGKLSRYTSNPGTQHCYTEDNSSTSGWVFLLGGGAIS
nr:zinc finger, CCHC-type [Tanacetum cinerariifolium]